MKTLTIRSERDLVAKAAAGSREAFDSLVDLHYQAVYAHAYRILRNSDDASDATQTAFVKALRSIAEFDVERPMRPWLYRICGNVCIDLARARHRTNESIDKHAYNLGILRRLHPEVEVVEADLAEPGDWAQAFAGAAVVVQLHAQITGKHRDLFDRNNLDATRHVLDACRAHAVPYLVHISSSVVNSVATDDYTETKKLQEAMVVKSGLRHCVLRPQL